MPSFGASCDEHDVEADEHQDEGARLDRHREREHEQLGIGPEHREGDAHAEHRARGADERAAPTT